MLIAPNESPRFRAIGRVSMAPERFGVDAMWTSKGHKYGVQRKAVPDLLASVADGRLEKELGQMSASGITSWLVIEGKIRWTDDGVMMNGGFGRDWTRAGWWGLMAHVQRVCGVMETRDEAETIACIQGLEKWTRKTVHGSGRPGPTGIWGTRATDRDFAVHLLTGFPGVGVGVAGDIYDHFGRVPLKWDVGEEEMMGIKGLGPKRVRAMYQALQ